MYSFSDLKKKTDQVSNWLKSEYSGLRTGRATPTVLDVVKVDAYGSKMPINQVASISIEDPKTLRITPWDSSVSKDIERAIQNSGLGMSVGLDEKGVRVHFPDLSEERRSALVKVCKQKLEEARISVRAERDKVWEDIQEKTKEGKLSDDDKFRLKNEMQKVIDEANKELEELAEKKEKEILEK